MTSRAKDTGFLRNLISYDSSGNISLPANLSIYVNKEVATKEYVDAQNNGQVLQSRTLTINGTTYDLSANRSWTINPMIYPSVGIALSTGSGWGTSITNNSSNWNTAYGWGNHASAGYLTSFTELDPTVPSHVKAITTTNISNWNTSYGWGNHASAGYLTSFTESDPTVGSHIKSITITNISNWNTAYGWGNHASAGYAKGSGTIGYLAYFTTTTTVGDSIIYQNPNGIQVSGNISIGQGYSLPGVAGKNTIACDTQGFFFQKGTSVTAYLSLASLSAARSYILPDASGTLALTSQIPSLSGYLPLSGGTLTGRLISTSYFTVDGTGPVGQSIEAYGHIYTGQYLKVEINRGLVCTANESVPFYGDGGGWVTPGNLTCNTLTQTSDIRFKNILESNPSIDVRDISIIKYTMGDSERIRYGYSAQQVQEFLPDSVYGTDRLSVDYSEIHTVKIASLEKRIAELEALLVK